MTTRAFKCWSIAIALAGVLAGGAAGLRAQEEEGLETGIETGIGGSRGGCKCTIEGSGSHKCGTTHACVAGNYSCTVTCS